MKLTNIKQILLNTKQYELIDAFEENINGVFVKHTYKDFLFDVRELASYIIEKEVKDQNIAIIGENSYRWVVSFFAIVISGNIAVPVDKDISQDDIDKLIDNLHIKYLLMSDSCLKHIYVSEDSISISFNEELRCDKTLSEKELFSYKEEDDEKTICIILTSGTSGYNKAVMLSNKNICTNIESVIKLNVITKPNGYLLSVLPMYHSYELFCNTFASIWYGRTLVIDNDIRHYIKNLINYKPETHVVVPSILNFIAKKVNLLEDLRFNIVVGGAALDPSIYKEMHNNGFNIYPGYGMSEASPLIAVKKEYDEDSNACELFFTDIKINRTDDELDGEILIKGDNITKGYYGDPESTKKSFTPDGWFKTGDLGYIKDGKLFLTGRLKNTIILENGKNVQPEQIEQIIYDRLAYIDDVVVIEMTLNEEKVIGAVFYSSYINLLDNSEQLIKDVKEINKILEPHQQITGISISNNVLPKNKILKTIRKNVHEQMKTYKTYIVR